MKSSILIRNGATLVLLVIVDCLGIHCTATEPSSDRGISRDAAVTGVDYARKWGIVVGCDYAGHPNPRSVPQLRSAENDARSVYEELIHNYGYEADRTCFLVLGSGTDDARATRDHIITRLKDIVGRCNTEAGSGLDGPKQSLLFFFAGHGSGFRNGTAAYGKLFPVDVTVDIAGDEPVMGNTLFLPELVEYIEGCRAFHKLMILDCCESGLLFEDFKVASSESAERSIGGGVARTDFSAEALVGLTAGTQVERVKDATDLLPGHSPFTGALLHALGTALGEPAAGPFAATELYVDITRQLERYNESRPEAPVTQRPQIGKLPVGMAGDFFFVPRQGFTPAQPHPTDKPLALAGLGGLTGPEWIDQWPWFTPAVRAALPAVDQRLVASGGPGLEARLRIALQLPAQSTAVDAPPAALMETLHHILEDHRLAQDTPEPFWDDFVTLSNAEIVPAERAALLSDLHDRISANPSAADLHLAALLESRLDRAADADKHFASALKRLAADAAAKPLFALCSLDYAQHLLATNRWRECTAACEQAQRAAGDTPGNEYLRIEAACVQVAALRKRDRVRDAEAIFSGPIAFSVGQLAARGVTLHPMLAWLAERHAWCLMDQWRLAEARAQFDISVDLRGQLCAAASSSPPLVHQLSQLHSKHGLAMIAHFTCSTDDAGPIAGKKYEEIVTGCDEMLPRPAMEETLILERAVNSLERHADSLLFMPSPKSRSPELAASLLSQAIRREKVRQRRVGGDSKRSPIARLHLKRSLAMVLAGDPSAAARDRAAANDTLQSSDAETPDRVTRLLSHIADVIAGQTPEDVAGLVSTASELTSKGPESSAIAGREEVDIALFGLAVAARTNVADSEEARELLVSLLDRFNELRGARVPLLRYLRRYRDEVVSWVATRGDEAASDVADAVRTARGDAPFANAEDNAVSVLLHAFEDGRGWLAVLQPAGGAARGDGRVIAFEGPLPERESRGPPPGEIVSAASGLANEGDGVVVAWADPVLGFANDDYPFTLPAGWTLSEEVPAHGEDAR